MGGVLDLLESFLDEVAHDGRKLLSADVDVFGSIADQQPSFQQWRAALQEEQIRSPDATKKYKWFNLVLSEARNPQNQSMQETEDMTVQLAMEMAAAGLRKMRDPKIAISDWLCSQNGKYSQLHSAEAHTATIGAHTTNDRVESVRIIAYCLS